MSIKIFIDYKHLLQDNYVEYKHTFLTLLKLVYKILSCVYCCVNVLDITNFKVRITDTFATINEDLLQNTWREIDYRLDVLHVTCVTVPDITNLKARITDTFATITEDMLQNTW